MGVLKSNRGENKALECKSLLWIIAELSLIKTVNE